MPKDDFAKARAKQAAFWSRVNSRREAEKRDDLKRLTARPKPSKQPGPLRAARITRAQKNYNRSALTIQQTQSLLATQGRLRIGGGLNRIKIIPPPDSSVKIRFNPFSA